MKSKAFNPTKTLIHLWEDGQEISIWHLDRSCWTFCHTDPESGRVECRVGPMYPTKDALMIAAPEYLKVWGL